MESVINAYLAVELFLKTWSSTDDGALYVLQEHLEEELIILAQDEYHLFSSSRSRLNYLFSKGKVGRDEFHKLVTFHEFCRKESEIPHWVFDLGIGLWVNCIHIETGIPIPEQWKVYLDIPVEQATQQEQSFHHQTCMRISILDLSTEDGCLNFILSEDPGNVYAFDWDLLGNKLQKHIKQCIHYLKLPFDAMAWNLRSGSRGYVADALILMPDYLLDVTTVAACCQGMHSYPIKMIVQQFIDRPMGLPALIGNSVNYLMDELIIDQKADYREILKQVFCQNPLTFCKMDNAQLHQFSETVKLHYHNLLPIIQGRFNQEVEALSNCILEPSFYSVDFGIQGRLDVFYREAKLKKIFELKSGKPYHPNQHGINEDHYAQTILYYLMIQSVYGQIQDCSAFVLYSSQEEQGLRLAPPDPHKILQLLEIRNALLVLQLHLAFHPKSESFLLDVIKPEHFQGTEQFTRRDGNSLIQIYQTLSSIEKDYFKEFCGFIAREQIITKTGRFQTQYTEGMASLWLLSDEEKRRQFGLITDLKIQQITTPLNDFPILELREEGQEIQLANFRVGDTLVLYPKPNPLKEQIFKGTLIELKDGAYLIRMRNRQFPRNLIDLDLKWNLEHDYLDRSFSYQFQSLMEWASAPEPLRKLLLGRVRPEIGSKSTGEFHPEIPNRMIPVLQKIRAAKNYFLLWGPPGAGKTSMVIRFLTEALVVRDHEQIMLLAYTNRAVDEICEMLDWVEETTGLEYLRIGSRYGVHEKFKSRLLDEKARLVKDRNEMNQLLNRTRIFTGTIASILGKKELFSLKTFDTLIVDEASQILEPQLIGLLTRFKRFILIGDHMQLPAVTAQTDEESRIESHGLKQYGFNKLSTSFFERMFRQCQDNAWENSFEMLEFQGRMHYEIMQYPSWSFYHGRLEILPESTNPMQTAKLSDRFPKLEGTLWPGLATHRTIFLSCIPTLSKVSLKTNPIEAQSICKLVESLIKLHQLNQVEWNENRLGIICPFRAQIALIKQYMNKIPWIKSFPITVDTAERYQGGSRDIIILSTVISDPKQLAQISSVNDQGADRKLNVAITRAKEQIIVIGNPLALSASTLYQQLMEQYTCMEIKDLQPIEGMIVNQQT